MGQIVKLVIGGEDYYFTDGQAQIVKQFEGEKQVKLAKKCCLAKDRLSEGAKAFAATTQGVVGTGTLGKVSAAAPEPKTDIKKLLDL